LPILKATGWDGAVKVQYITAIAAPPLTLCVTAMNAAIGDKWSAQRQSALSERSLELPNYRRALISAKRHDTAPGWITGSR
jgi:hypothetical protein